MNVQNLLEETKTVHDVQMGENLNIISVILHTHYIDVDTIFDYIHSEFCFVIGTTIIRTANLVSATPMEQCKSYLLKLLYLFNDLLQSWNNDDIIPLYYRLDESGIPFCFTDTGIVQCPCRNNFGGEFCNECADGFYNFPECVRKLYKVK